MYALQIVDLMLEGVQRTEDGRVDYLDFVTAARFSGLPSKPYKRKFRCAMCNVWPMNHGP